MSTLPDVLRNFVEQLEALHLETQTLIDSRAKYLEAERTAHDGRNNYERFADLRESMAKWFPLIADDLPKRTFEPTGGQPVPGALRRQDLRELQHDIEDVLALSTKL
jgi:hypothetical protein